MSKPTPKTNRYARQLQVRDYGPEAQEQLNDARVLIVGAGGLGAPVAATLAGAGVGHVHVVDHDDIELSNLHRQWLYQEADIGQAKSLVLARHLAELNTSITIDHSVVRVGPKNVAGLVQTMDLVVDAADNFPCSFLLSDHCNQRNIPLATASVNQLYGYAGIFCGEHSPSLRAVFPQAPKQQTSCDVTGVTGPAVSMIAALQAHIALAFLNGANTETGRMHYMDLRNFSLRSIDCSHSKEPTSNQIELIDAADITPSDWVIDVRDADEAVATQHSFQVDQHLPLNEFEASCIAADKRRLVFFCKSGQRAMVAAQLSIESGQERIAVAFTES